MRVEEAHRVLERMSYDECIKMWNEYASDHYRRSNEIHSMDENDWWVYLIELIEGRYFAADMLKSEYFDSRDTHFYYDYDKEQFKSFSSKDDLLFVCSEDFFIECLMKKEVDYGC